MRQTNMYDMLHRVDSTGNPYWSARDLMLTFNTFSWVGITAIVEDTAARTSVLNDGIKHVVPVIDKDNQVDYHLSGMAVFMALSQIPMDRSVTVTAMPYFASLVRGELTPIRATVADMIASTPPRSTNLSVSSYLHEHGMGSDDIARKASAFGKRVAALYRENHDAEPPKVDVELNGELRSINGYTDDDRPLFDEVWSKFYASPATS